MPNDSPFRYLDERQARRMLNELERAVAHAGGYTALAAQLSEQGKHITPQGLLRWTINGVPAERAVQIERVTQGVVLRQNLRPDLYDGMRPSTD